MEYIGVLLCFWVATYSIYSRGTEVRSEALGFGVNLALGF